MIHLRSVLVDTDAVGTLLLDSIEGFLHVVDEGQRHLVHVGALVRQEAAPLDTRRSYYTDP